VIFQPPVFFITPYFLSIAGNLLQYDIFPGGVYIKTDSKMCLETCFRHKDSIIYLFEFIFANVRFKNVMLTQDLIFLCDSNTIFWYRIVILKFYKLYYLKGT